MVVFNFCLVIVIRVYPQYDLNIKKYSPILTEFLNLSISTLAFANLYSRHPLPCKQVLVNYLYFFANCSDLLICAIFKITLKNVGNRILLRYGE